MTNVLNRLEPVTLPIDIAPLPSAADKTLTVSSGIDVPTATTVSPTIKFGHAQTLGQSHRAVGQQHGADDDNGEPYGQKDVMIHDSVR